VGAFVGLTTRGYQSGEVDYDGHMLMSMNYGPLC